MQAVRQDPQQANTLAQGIRCGILVRCRKLRPIVKSALARLA